MKEYAWKVFRLALVLALVLGLLPVQAQPVNAVSQNIVISQVYGGGGNANATYTNDFVELFNRGTASVSLAGWSVQYTSATSTGLFSGGVTTLSGTVDPGHYFLIQLAAGSSCANNTPCGAALPVTPDLTGSTNMSGTGGKVALVNGIVGLDCNGSPTSPCKPEELAQIVDLLGWGGANFSETAPAAVTSSTTSSQRAGSGCTDTDNNAVDFASAAPTPRNSSSEAKTCPTSTPPSGIGSASPSSVMPGASTLLTVVATPGTGPASTGIGVACDLSPIGGASSVAFTDNGSNSFSYTAAVAEGTTGGAKTLTCSVTDAEKRSGTASIALTVIAPVPIGSVNGVVTDTENGATHISPVKGQSVIIQGVIYEKTIQATSSTPSYGFFIQNTAATADTDPKTSDGLFVFMNKVLTMNGPSSSTYTPTVGDEVIISGTVSEYYNFTELTNPTLLAPVVRSNVDLDDELAPVVVNPPASLADANRYWERLQGMRLQVPVNSIVLNGRGVFNPADAETWLASPESAIAKRTDTYSRRAFRDSHPLDDNYDPANWDGNGYRIVIGSMGIKALAGDPQALLAPSRTFDTLNAPVVGGLNYTYSKYRIEVTSQPEYTSGADPALNNPPQEITRSTAYSIVDYNLENLYDYRDNPFSGCDFAGNSGCAATGTPFLSGVNPPYDYVPASDAAYQARLTDIAKQIINNLHSPDILMVQEVENQDICSVADGSLVCGTSDNADTKPDVLQELALKIASLGGPAYDAAFDRDSSDLRGIAPSYLYRTDRVELLPFTGDPVLGADPMASVSPVFDYAGATVPGNAQTSNPKTLNAVLPATFKASDRCETAWVFPRAADVALFRIYSTSINEGSHQDVYVINNHFKSTPDSCVAHRTEQARLNAAIIKFIQAAKPGARIIMGGDLNVYARPDDTTPKTDQLASLYDETIGLKNLIEILVNRAPEAAYSYVYMGMAQTIDQMYVNQAMLAGLQTINIAHINSDFPADYPTDEARGTSDHDPSVAVFSFADNQLSVDGGGPYTVASGGSVVLNATGTDPEGGALTYAWDLDNNGTFETTGQSVTFSALTLAEPVAHTVKVRATNSIGLNKVAEALVTVTNQAPELAEPTSKDIPENAAYSFTASATDANVPPQALSYSLLNPPVNNAAIDSKTGEFSWTPIEEQGGSPYTYTIEVSDGYATTQKTFTLTVTKVNQAPVFAALADQSVTAPAKLSFTISATDADLPAQNLTYAVKQGTLPTGATFDAAKRTFTWTPSYLQAGIYTVTFTVSDGVAPAVEMPIKITVDKGNLMMLPIIATH